MKVMMRKSAAGVLSAYVAKKDLEETVVAQEKTGLWGGTVTLANGWVLALPELDPGTRLPITVEARRVAGD
ncbi:MAG TPA: putative nitrogen fixation protein NifT [Ramlibacter sp.]|nr:putative nitrogen fixation protein NifT [Ramlibacter sp.]